MTDEFLRADELLDHRGGDPRQRVDGAVAPDEAVVVVERLEVVQVRVQQSERDVARDAAKDLLLDAHVAGESGQR